MAIYKAPVKDMQFIFDDVLNVDQHSDLAGFADCTKETRDQILEELAKFCDAVLVP